MKYIKKPDIQVKMEQILKAPNQFVKTQNNDFIEKYKHKNWNTIRFNPDLALKFITVKIYFDKVEEFR